MLSSRMAEPPNVCIRHGAIIKSSLSIANQGKILYKKTQMDGLWVGAMH